MLNYGYLEHLPPMIPWHYQAEAVSHCEVCAIAEQRIKAHDFLLNACNFPVSLSPLQPDYTPIPKQDSLTLTHSCSSHTGGKADESERHQQCLAYSMQ